MRKNKRREFMKTSLAGICGAAVIPGAWKPRSVEGAEKGVGDSKGAGVGDSAGNGAGVADRVGKGTGDGAGKGAAAGVPAIPALPSRPLGKTGIVTPLISMGTAGATSVDFIRQGYDAGIKLFFSATYYGHGNNERLVGEALKGLPRDSFVVGTAATPDGLNPRAGTMPKDMKPEGYIKTAEDSLKRFGLDYVDILLVPYAAKREFIIFDPIMEAVTTLKKQGKIRFAGIAAHGSCEEAIRAAADAKVYEIAMTAYNYRTENKEAMSDALAYTAKAGLGILAFKTTAGGAGDKNRTRPFNSDAALKWVLQDPHVASIVSGMSSVEEMRKNLEMIKDLKLSDAELEDIRVAALSPGSSLYCQQCRQCVPQCPGGLEIPTLMRSYMYAYGYRDVAQARYTLEAVEVSGDPCGKCDACGVVCASGFNVRERVRDIVRLKALPLEFIKG
jgi:predicted aldo/keto reductase-like oxidoreductase